MRSATRKTALALRALRALPGDGDRWSRTALAEQIDATVAYLPQVLAPLVRAGWVASASGPQGGYSLTSQGLQVPLLAVLQVTQGWGREHRCVLACRPGGGPCPLHEPWASACDHFDRLIARVPVRHGLDPPTCGELPEHLA